MSAVVHVTPTEQPAGVSVAMIESLTAAAFGQRRKMLRQSLKGVKGAVEALATIGIDPERRAETVTVEEYVELGRALS
jgi:16S rRNA (adenine1518-N6/adenine1519-N6)-dimethyltransferase